MISCHKERISPYTLDITADLQLCQVIAAPKRTRPEFFYSLSQDNLFQLLAVLKRILSDLLYFGWNFHARQAFAVVKSIIPDLCHALRDLILRDIRFLARIPDQFRLSFVIQHSVITLVTAVPFFHLDLFQTTERIKFVIQCCHFPANIEFLNIISCRKERIGPYDLDITADLQICQVIAACKRTLPKFFYSLSQDNLLQVLAVLKRILSDPLHFGRNFHARQAFAVVKSIIPDLCHALRDLILRDIRFLARIPDQFRLSFVIQHSVITLVTAVPFFHPDLFQTTERIKFVVQCCHSPANIKFLNVISCHKKCVDSYVLNVAVNLQICQVIAALKCTLSKLAYALSQDNLFQVFTRIKCISSNPCNSISNDNLYNFRSVIIPWHCVSRCIIRHSPCTAYRQYPCFRIIIPLDFSHTVCSFTFIHTQQSQCIYTNFSCIALLRLINCVNILLLFKICTFCYSHRICHATVTKHSNRCQHQCYTSPLHAISSQHNFFLSDIFCKHDLQLCIPTTHKMQQPHQIRDIDHSIPIHIRIP